MRAAANALATFRALATLPIFWAVTRQEHGIAFLWFAAAALSDLADGHFARRTRPSALGALLDPLADKILVAGTALALAVARSIPMELAALLIAREGVVAVARLAAFRARTHHAAERLGKVKTAVQLVALALTVAAHPLAPAHGPAVALLWIAALVGIATMPRYRFRG